MTGKRNILDYFSLVVCLGPGIIERASTAAAGRATAAEAFDAEPRRLRLPIRQNIKLFPNGACVVHDDSERPFVTWDPPNLAQAREIGVFAY